jgi:hypothetical protein
LAFCACQQPALSSSQFRLAVPQPPQSRHPGFAFLWSFADTIDTHPRTIPRHCLEALCPAPQLSLLIPSLASHDNPRTLSHTIPQPTRCRLPIPSRRCRVPRALLRCPKPPSLSQTMQSQPRRRGRAFDSSDETRRIYMPRRSSSWRLSLPQIHPSPASRNPMCLIKTCWIHFLTTPARESSRLQRHRSLVYYLLL